MNWQSEDGALRFTDADVATMLEMADHKGGIHHIQKLTIEVSEDGRDPVFNLVTPCGDCDVLTRWAAQQGTGIRSAGYFQTRDAWLFYVVCEGVNMCVAKTWQSASARVAMHNANCAGVAA